jgi:hypothetical protein
MEGLYDDVAPAELQTEEVEQLRSTVANLSAEKGALQADVSALQVKVGRD